MPGPAGIPTVGRMQTLTYTTAIDIAAQVRAGRLTPREAVDASLARIAAEDPGIGAFQLVDAEGARRAADDLVGRDLTGMALAGVPVAVKDNIDVAGLPTRHGSWRPPSDGWSTTIRMQRCCTRLAACASARSCGARRKRISRRVSRSITAGAQISRLARCKRISAAPMKRMRIWPQR